MKVGAVVRLIKAAPLALPEDSRALWNACVGKAFAVTDIDENGLVEIEVSRWEEPHPDGDSSSCFDRFYLDPDEFEVVEP